MTGEKALTQRYNVARVAAMREVVKVSDLRHQEVLIIKPGKDPGRGDEFRLRSERHVSQSLITSGDCFAT
ncbi:hypothetical protein GCM10007872_06880 [Gluconobacter sphaericus NBRC 12467]|uniref:Uncharacterized protein n=1 Tax=Gluconobacter sphaericus NBRC 12467 TaxID=1307951 RepID=A0AA37W9C5_9PROT|nr:hypothetical protein GSP01_12560 [Gluconobacter sphaericus NBRC 12467]GLQ83780.1 hypothetical protein GCM10007872_06880 [Gluconobacter sphaericus NBRC 12467]